LAAIGAPATAASKATLRIRRSQKSFFIKVKKKNDKMGNINFLRSLIIFFGPIIFVESDNLWIREFYIEGLILF
jgi:hypothetical protein